MYAGQEIVFAVDPANIPPLFGYFTLSWNGQSRVVSLNSPATMPFSDPFHGQLDNALSELGVPCSTTLQNDRIVITFSEPQEQLVGVESSVTQPVGMSAVGIPAE